jgi:glucose-1-phosphate cytidylyltransferase
METVILAGGLGTRIREETEYRPKPMVPIAGKPILWHIMKRYADFHVNNFIICAGYKGEVIRKYFSNFEVMNSDFTVQLGKQGNINFHDEVPEKDWKVTVAETGAETMTGGRVFKVRKYLSGSTFMCTYGDGLSDINFDELLKFHKSHGKIATVSAVRPSSRFGAMEIGNNSEVFSFTEKPQNHEWVNAGFFVFEMKIFDYLDENAVLEKQPLENLARDGQLMAYKHDGFWQPMDTYREMVILTEMWNSGSAPWSIK